MDQRNINIQTGNFKGFDFDYARERIKKAMDEKGCTQRDLESALNISQSNISKGLSGSSFFSLDNFFRICDYLDLSMDEISGLSKKSEKTDSESLADLCSVFCQLNSITPFKTKKVTFPDDKSHYVLYFINESENVVKMVNTISKFNGINDENITDILETWEEGFKNRNKNRLKKYDFYDEEEYAFKLLANWVSAVGTLIYAAGFEEWDRFNAFFHECIRTHGKEGADLMYKYMGKFTNENALTDEQSESLYVFEQLYEKKYEKE